MMARVWFASALPTVVCGALGLSAGVIACGGGEATQPPPNGPQPLASASGSALPTAIASATASATTPPPPPKPALLELQKKSVKDTKEAFDAHDAKRLAAAYAPDGVMVEHGMAGLKETKGRDDIERVFTRLFTPFPDAKFGVYRVFAKGDVVIQEFGWVGTNEGPTPMGNKPTHKKVGQRAVSVQRFDAEGLIKREEVYMDDLTIAMQLGMKEIPGKPRAVPELPTADAPWIVEGDDKALDAAKTGGWTAFYGKHDRKGFEGVIGDDTLHVDVTMPSDAKGKKALLAEYDQWLRVFPDLKVEVGEGWGFSGGFAIYEVTLSGTMKGAWGPNKPTNRPVTTHVLAVDRIVDGKIVESWTYANGAEPLGQINPPKPPTPKKP